MRCALCTTVIKQVRKLRANSRARCSYVTHVTYLTYLTSVASLHAADPVPESEQAVRALKIIDACHGKRPNDPPKKLHVVYFTPSGRDPEPRYRERLEPILEDIRAFYGENMKRLGFGAKTFSLAHDPDGKVSIYLVKGQEPESAFPGWAERNGGNTGAPVGGEIVTRESRPILEKAGVFPDHETILYFCNLASWDEKALTFRHHSPYFGHSTQTSGLCFALDTVIQDVANFSKTEPILKDAEWGKESLGKFNTVFIGGIAHELGHAFSLPHCGRRWDEEALGTSLMGAGNHTYREELRHEGKGSFLTMASAMLLAARPLFNGSDKNEAQAPHLEQCALTLSTNVTRADLAGRRAAIRVEGTVTGSPPIYGVIAYFDSMRNDQSEYDAPTATSVPDEHGRFAIEISDLPACGNGALRIELCHANGAVSHRRLDFGVGGDGSVDVMQWSDVRQALKPVADAVAHNEPESARAALRTLEDGDAPELTRNVARALVATLDGRPKLSPADAPSNVTSLPLGDANPELAEVGWLKPAANRVPTNAEKTSPLLDSARIYCTGLYAHAPSRYVFNLEGKWNRLRGEAGLHTASHNRAFGVVFVIKTDGHEVFRSSPIRGPAKPHYDINLTDVKTLELIVEKAVEQNGGNWGLWLDPMLSRGG